MLYDMLQIDGKASGLSHGLESLAAPGKGFENMAKNRIKMSICGCDFAVCSEEDEAYIRSIGDEVQKSLNDMMEKNERLSLTMAAVIAAMNYCDASHKASSTAENLRTQIKNYLEDSSHARMDAEESHRELERIRRENQNLRAHLPPQMKTPTQLPVGNSRSQRLRTEKRPNLPVTFPKQKRKSRLTRKTL